MSTTEREIVGSPAVQAPVSNPSILDPRVERGAELLDERMPGWAGRVNPDTLRIMDGCRCVLGQLHGGDDLAWMRVMKAWGLSTGGEYGFSGDDLEQDWRLAILSRRVLDTADPSGSAPSSSSSEASDG